MMLSSARIPHPLAVVEPDWACSAAAAVVGSRWPAGDQAATWDVADRWYGLAEALSGPRATAFQAADQITFGLIGAGIAPDGFREAWDALAAGEDAPLNALVQIAAELGQLVEECGREIEAAKVEMWIEVATVLTELAGLVIATELTLGAASLAATGLITASQVAVERIFERLVDQVGGKVPDMSGLASGDGVAARGRHTIRITGELVPMDGSVALAAGVARRRDAVPPAEGALDGAVRRRPAAELPAPVDRAGIVTRRLAPPRRTGDYRHSDFGAAAGRRDPADREPADHSPVGRPTIPMQRSTGRHDRDIEQVRRTEYADFLSTVAEGIRTNLGGATPAAGTSAGRALRAYADEVESEAALVRSRPRGQSAPPAPEWARGDRPRQDRAHNDGVPDAGVDIDQPWRTVLPEEPKVTDRARASRAPTSPAPGDRGRPDRTPVDEADGERSRINPRQPDGPRSVSTPGKRTKSGRRRHKRALSSSAPDDRARADWGHHDPARRERTRNHTLDRTRTEPAPHEPAHRGPTRGDRTDSRRVADDWSPGDRAQATAPQSPGGLRSAHRVPQNALAEAVPKAGDGRPDRLADPRVGQWFSLLNAGGPAEDPARGLNCLDAVLALFATYQGGRPRVAAARTFDGYPYGEPDRPVGGEWSGVRRIQQTTRSEFQNLCPFVGGAEPESARAAIDTALRNLANHLHNSGHGAFAFILTDFETGGCHAWAAINQDGTILYLDPQLSRISVEEPLYRHRAEPGNANVVSMDALVVDGEGRPAPLPYHGAGQWTAQAILEESP